MTLKVATGTLSVASGVLAGLAQTVTVSPAQVLSGSNVVLGGETHTAQSPDQSYSLAVDPDPAPNYTRYELRAEDQWANDVTQFGDGRQRCELKGNTFWPYNTDIWMAGSCRVTTASFKNSATAYNIFMQFQQPAESGESGKHPTLAIGITQGVLSVYTHGDLNAVTTTATVDPTLTWFSTDFTPYLGQWVSWVIRAQFSKTVQNGQLDAWMNGAHVVSQTGILMGYNDVHGPNAKIGLYREGYTETAVVEWANREIGTADLSARVTSPLPTPA